MPLTRVFFTSDVHGSEICFLKFLNSAKFYKADALILGGDITGKLIVPLIQQPDGSHLAEFLGIPQIVKTEEERQKLEKQIRDSGYYPYLTTQDEFDKLHEDKRLLDGVFSTVMANGVKRWISIAEERLKGSNVKCYISPGNDDRFDIDDALKNSTSVICPEDRVVRIDQHHEMITTGWTNSTPWHSPRETTEEKLDEILNNMISKVEQMKNCIFNLHCPPYGTPLDIAPELDESLKPKVTSGGGTSMIHVGSTTIRKAIVDHQPLLAVHGHIHEARGVMKIGRTLCVNPGSEYGEGILRGLLVNLDEKSIKSYLLTSG